MNPGPRSSSESQAAAPPKGASTYGALRWSMASTITQRVVSIGALAIIARLISETAYGVYRELLSLHFIVFVVLPLGIDQLYVRDIALRATLDKCLRAALAFSAVCVAALVLLFRERTVAIFKLQGNEQLLYVFPLALAFQSAKLLYKTRLSAQLDFRRIGMGEFLNTVVTMAGGALVVFFWRTPAALYLTYTAGEIAEYAFLRFGTASHRSSFAEGLASLRSLDANKWKFATLACGDQLLNALGTNAPVLFLGADDPANAAQFSMASALVTLPLLLLVGTFSQVALPSLAGRSEKDLQERTLEILGTAAAFIVPVLIGVGMFAKPLVHLVLGPSWVDSTPPLVAWLALFCATAGLFSPISTLDVIRDRMDLGFIWNLVNFALRISALAIGFRWGVLPAVAAFSIVSALMRLLQGLMLGWLLRAGMWRFHKTWLQFVPAWVALFVLCAIFRQLVSDTILSLCTAALAGAVYIALIFWFYPFAGEVLLRLLKLRRLSPVLLRRTNPTDTADAGLGAIDQALPEEPGSLIPGKSPDDHISK